MYYCDLIILGESKRDISIKLSGVHWVLHGYMRKSGVNIPLDFPNYSLADKPYKKTLGNTIRLFANEQSTLRDCLMQIGQNEFVCENIATMLAQIKPVDFKKVSGYVVLKKARCSKNSKFYDDLKTKADLLPQIVYKSGQFLHIKREVVDAGKNTGVTSYGLSSRLNSTYLPVF